MILGGGENTHKRWAKSHVLESNDLLECHLHLDTVKR